MAPKYTNKLAGQRVLILGASSGIGFAVAEAAFEHGANLVLSSSNQSKLDKAVVRLKEAYPAEFEKQTVTTHVCDLSNAANLDMNLQKLFEAATDNGANKLNHIATTAGDALTLSKLAELTPEIIWNTMNVRYVAPAMIAKYIPKYVENSPSSSFTMTGGMRGQKPAPDWTITAATCCAIDGLVRGLAFDLAPVRVNVVHPGAVSTELFSMFPADQLEGIMQMFRDGTTTGTVGRPEDLAESYIYFMKDQFVTGSTIESNGGALLK